MDGSCIEVPPQNLRENKGGLSNELEDYVGQLRPAALLKEVAGAYMEY